MSEFDSSDVLPYTQVDRTAKSKAALLAGHLKVSAQHALGSLVEFWDLCAGDQRDLQRVIERTPEGQEPAIILAPEDVALRFHLASGHEVQPVVLERLGLLEARPEGFRVRGMSRYFRPVLTKAINRANGSKGGKSSKGASSDRSTPASSDRSSDRLATAQPPPQATAERPLDQEVSSQQSAVSIQQEALNRQQSGAEDQPPPKTLALAAFAIEGPDPERMESWSAQEFWKAFELERRQCGYPPEKWPAPNSLRDWWTEARSAFDVRVLGMAASNYYRDEHWKAARPPCPWAGFAKQWHKYLPRKAVAS